MKITKYLFLFILFVGCNSKEKRAASQDTDVVNANIAQKKITLVAFKPYQINSDYTVIDAGEYTNDGPMSGGHYAIVKNGNFIDTIDLFFGLKDLGNKTYLCHKLKDASERGDVHPKKGLILDVDDYLLISDSHPSHLKNLTQHFDDYYSSPNVINHKIYFWQLAKIDTVGNLKVSAAEFDPYTNKTKNYFLLNDDPETDDCNYFPLPYLENNAIVFTMNGKKKWKYAVADFKPY